MAVLVVVTAAGVFADGRVLVGDPIWMKPFKFSVSIFLYALTLAWMLALLPRRSRPAEWSAVVIVLSLFIEMAIVVVQVIRGTTSHYNMATPFDAALWNVMFALFLAHLLIAVAVLRARIPDRVVRTGVALGVGVSLLGLFVATPMGSANQPTVGAADGGPGMPVVG